MLVADQYPREIKGHVSIDLYDENNNIIDHIEKHNVVTNNSGRIIAQILSDPTRENRRTRTEVHDTSLGADEGVYKLALDRAQGARYTEDLVGDGSTKTFYLTPPKSPILKLYSVTVNGVHLDVGDDVWISNDDESEITFREAPEFGYTISVTYSYVINTFSRILPYTEVVMVGPTRYTRSFQRTLTVSISLVR